jgi:hypothetical protein
VPFLERAGVVVKHDIAFEDTRSPHAESALPQTHPDLSSAFDRDLDFDFFPLLHAIRISKSFDSTNRHYRASSC